MSSPLVSVVIAAYNAAQFLPATLASATSQTYPHLEIHVVDDGSTDETAALLERARLGDSRITVHQQPNRGQASAKNLGVERSRGEYVAFLDADDVWMPDKIALQVPLMAPEDVGVCYTDTMFIDENGQLFSRPRLEYHSGWITEPLFLDNFVNFPSTMVKRRCFDELGMFDEDLTMGIDWDLWLRFSTRYRFVYLDQPLLQYRVWAGQMSSNIDGRFDGATRIMRKFERDHPTAVAPPVRRRAWINTLLNRARQLYAAGRKHEARRAVLAAVRLGPHRGRLWLELAKVLAGTRGSA